MRLWKAGLLVGLFVSTSLASVEVLLDPSPQAYQDTCQSYALALAISWTGDPRFPVDTTKELRDLEEHVRDTVERIATATGSDASSHAVWEKAVSTISSGTMRLKSESFVDPAEFYESVSRLTGQSSVELGGPLFSALIARRPVLTSVLRIGDNRYATGHIVAVFGSATGAPNSAPRGLVVLNSALKTKDSRRIACQPDDRPGDERYSASVSIESDYVLKTFDDRLKLMWVE